MIDIGTIGSIVGALGLGSVGGQYLATGGQRRETRGAVLRALAHVEESRWAPFDESLLTEAIRDLETAALLARMPRDAVRQYKVLATAAAWVSQDDYDESIGAAESGGIPLAFAEVVRASAAELTWLAWAPWRGRVFLRRRLERRASAAEAEAKDRPAVKAQLERAQRWVV